MAAHVMELDIERDRYEIPLIRAAIERDMPVFGICRGVQALAVALGGRLILDIPTQVPGCARHHADREPPRHSARHELEIRPGSLLASILPPAEHRCSNSRHHQAVLAGETCPGIISAVAPGDGVAEAMEISGRRWTLGVQWHPEYLGDPEIRAAHAPLFRAFVDACR
jgi:putative glutamine amidotransferase